MCYESAIQRNELEITRHKEALRLLVNYVAELVFADETHKDRNSARRRRAWGIRNSVGIPMSRWFQLSVRYSLIEAMYINGLISTTLCIVRRDQISEK